MSAEPATLSGDRAQSPAGAQSPAAAQSPAGGEPPDGGAVPARAQLRVIDLPGGNDPMSVARSLASRPGAAFLSGDWFGGGTALLSDPVRTIRGAGRAVLDGIDEQPVVTRAGEGAHPDHEDGVPAIGGGWIAALGYHALDRAGDPGDPMTPPEPMTAPDLITMSFHDHVLRALPDGRWRMEQLWTPERAEQLDAALVRAARLVQERPAAPGAPMASERGSAQRPLLRDVIPPEREPHVAAVRRCRELIAAGTLYQANICTQLRARLDAPTIDLWAALIEALHPARGAYLPAGGGTSMGASPELFLARRGRRVRTEPIKGTRPRAADPARDEALRAELRDSTKDRAENVMIVDLMRNDLGRVAQIGTVRPTSLLALRAGVGVWSLHSAVEATLRDDVTDADLIAATWAPGSVTGAPKHSATAAIAELERAPRGLYTGAVGLASPVAGLELAVVIRTFEAHGEHVVLGIGGGITEGSDPDAEFDECLVKAAPLLRAAGAALPPG